MAPTDDDKTLLEALEELREEVARSFVMTASQLQETFDDSVRRGRITRGDAERLADKLLGIVRSQRRELLDDLEVVLNKSGAVVADLVGAKQKPKRAAAEPEFPIDDYESLNAKQVIAALEGLDAAQLLAVREREQAAGARKTVLGAIDKRLK